eukprot:CAMPEP_0206178696 /NCGR_PEP_ID=MMETSP1474-20131121/65047_1 /ASSEMBLY_ACC=CAM_ASM_001110 /TAXON_ID=97495 /ORGANISM="Imantonia sp., Strain RCC918" /LENGTH=58 /DNA_ID=CAMNT_0053591383 /DNA_START=1138 /DNA_END=1314 /DNA_ORIENTATION=-
MDFGNVLNVVLYVIVNAKKIVQVDVNQMDLDIQVLPLQMLKNILKMENNQKLKNKKQK